MIGATGAARVFIATRPVDFRKGADGLAALVRDMMGKAFLDRNLVAGTGFEPVTFRL